MKSISTAVLALMISATPAFATLQLSSNINGTVFNGITRMADDEF